MITVERASRITNRFGLGFTEDYVLRRILCFGRCS